MSGGGRSELARFDRGPLQPLDGRREAPDRKWMAIRSSMERRVSARSIVKLSCAAAELSEVLARILAGRKSAFSQLVIISRFLYSLIKAFGLFEQES